MPSGHGSRRIKIPASAAGLYSTDWPISIASKRFEVPKVAEVGILIIDDDIVSQRALKNVLDSEGWRVRIVPLASHAMAEVPGLRVRQVVLK